MYQIRSKTHRSFQTFLAKQRSFSKNDKNVWNISKIRKQLQSFRKSLKKKKEYELSNVPLSTSVLLETSRQNFVPRASVGYKHVHKGNAVMSNDAATYQCRELKQEKSLIPLAPIVSHGVVEEQHLQITCFQASYLFAYRISQVFVASAWEQ